MLSVLIMLDLTNVFVKMVSLDLVKFVTIKMNVVQDPTVVIMLPPVLMNQEASIVNVTLDSKVMDIHAMMSMNVSLLHVVKILNV